MEEDENIDNIPYKIIKKFKQKNLYLVEKKYDFVNYFLQIIEIEESNEDIYEKLDKFNLEYTKKEINDKLELLVLMKATESKDYKILNEIDWYKGDFENTTNWKIFIKLVIELILLKSRNINTNIKPNQIFISQKNSVKINLIDLILNENNDEEKGFIIPFKNSAKEIKDMEKNQKKISWSLGIILLYLNFDNFEMKKYSESEIREFIKSKKIDKLDGPLINIILKLLCEEEKRITLDELILDKDFLYKVVELNLFSELINSEEKAATDIDRDSLPFFIICNSCNKIPNMSLLDSKKVLFHCSKCHLTDIENFNKLRDLRNLFVKWIKIDKNISWIQEDILEIFQKTIKEKVKFIYKTIKFMDSIKNSDSETKIIYIKTISNILAILFEQIQFGKDLIIFYNSIENTIRKLDDYNEIKVGNQILDYIKSFLVHEEKKEKDKKDKNNIIDIKNDDKDIYFKKIEANNMDHMPLSYKKENIIKSFEYKAFQSTIIKEKEKYQILANKMNLESKKFFNNYINNSFSNKKIDFSNYNNKYKYLEDSIDFSRVLNQYVTIESYKNPNNFLDIDSTLRNFKDYSSKLNSKDHGNFILSLLGKFFQLNGMNTHILKQKDKNFDKIELCSLQTLFSLGTQRKYEIHFDFGETENEKLLGDKNYQIKFLEMYKEKIANKLKIDKKRIILKDVKHGSLKVTFSLIDQTSNEDRTISRLNDLDDVIEIEKRVMIDEILLSPDVLDPKGDRYSGWGVDEKRGGEKYIPPIGWIGIGLKVLDKYENNNWLSYSGIDGEYSIAYYGLHNYLNDKDEMVSDLNDVIVDIRKVISERSFQDENDMRHSGFLGLFRKNCNGGVCLFQDPAYAENCAGIFRLNGIEYKILLMCRVNPKKIRQPVKHNKFWILNPTPDEIRPYRILLKRIINSSLSLENKIRVNLTPIDYIIQAINSQDYSFYDLHTDRRLSKYYPNDNDAQEIKNSIFAMKVYSSIYYKPINTYMFNGNILQTFTTADDKYTLTGFSKEQLNSAICCIQNAIISNNNVKNNSIVYRGMADQFNDDINVGSQFYFSSFVSTSYDKEQAEGFLQYQKNHKKKDKGTLMEIKLLNNGMNGNYLNYCFNIENISISPEQREVVICSHCYFQVTNITRSNPDDYVELVCKGYVLDNLEINNIDNNEN